MEIAFSQNVPSRQLRLITDAIQAPAEARPVAIVIHANTVAALQPIATVAVSKGIGWVVLYQDPVDGSLFNLWVNEHDAGHAAGAKPLLVMDVFEHAFMLDYGLKRADYIAAFWKNVNWAAVEARLR